MKINNLRRSLFYRKNIKKHNNTYTEVQTHVLVCIYIMNNDGLRCSCNTLFKYLSSIGRTPYKKTLYSTIKLFKKDETLRSYGKGSGTNLILTFYGKILLNNLEKNLKSNHTINYHILLKR